MSKSTKAIGRIGIGETTLSNAVTAAWCIEQITACYLGLMVSLSFNGKYLLTEEKPMPLDDGQASR
jgi:hypothetical protein